MRLSGLTTRGGGTVIGGAITALSGQMLVWLIGFPTSVLMIPSGLTFSPPRKRASKAKSSAPKRVDR